jgi:threonine/homoserine/homoserine lactone efflux protein
MNIVTLRQIVDKQVQTDAWTQIFIVLGITLTVVIFIGACIIVAFFLDEWYERIKLHFDYTANKERARLRDRQALCKIKK